MAPRRSTTQNQLSPQDFPAASSSTSSPASPVFTRPTSPSNGFSQFFTKPGKWFSRKASSGRTSPRDVEPPRPSTSSGRKPKISRPTDPRPILTSKLQSDPRISSAASRSVHDLSMRPPGSLDIPAQLSSPNTGGLGDLRNVSRKGWSRSVDDLGKIPPPSSSPIDTDFRSKISAYRNRSNSNVSLHINTSNPTRQPFPTIVTSSPSSSPPQVDNDFTGSASGVSISVSSPSDLSKPLPLDPEQVHTRSHSFTPRLPSKLATPKLSFGPSSPKRKGFAVPEREINGGRISTGLDLRPPPGADAHHGSPPPSPSALRTTNMTNNYPPPISQYRNTTMLAPPINLEHDKDDNNDISSSKRTSQIVYNSSFINRLTELPTSHHPYHSPNLVLSKGWKPFKLELKGTKLSFYKPPSDRNVAVRDLFPVDLVPADEEEVVVVDSSPRKPNNTPSKEQPSSMRKKRAFWGRRTHPDLVHGENGIEKGTFEALIHEAVFATTFSLTEGGDSLFEMDGLDFATDGPNAMWKDYALAILLCLPSVVDRTQFENELTRCGSYLITGADETAKQILRSRVTWLAGEYLRYYAEPADATEWEAWRTENIPELSASSNIRPLTMILDSAINRSTDTISTRTGQTVHRPRSGTHVSPSGSDQPGSIRVTANEPASPAPNPGSPPAVASRPGNTERIWVALDREGLSREVLLGLDPRQVAHSLALFHRATMRETSSDLTAQYVMPTKKDKRVSTNPATDSMSSPDTLFGSEKALHWLTKMLLIQILGNDTSTGSIVGNLMSPSLGPISEKQRQTTSRTHSRSELISVWVKIGELCRMAGDEASFQSIATAICSRPIARLEKAWKRAHPDAIRIVTSWVYPNDNGLRAKAQEPKMTCWAGDIKPRLRELLDRAREDDGQLWLFEPLDTARGLFEQMRTSFALCPQRLGIDEELPVDSTSRLVTFWGEVYSGSSGSLSSKFQSIDQFMSLSLAAEPRRKGLFQPYFWSPSSSAPLSTHSLVPLSFPEPLPTITFVDREEIWRGRIDNAVPDLQITNVSFLQTLESRLNDPKSIAVKSFPTAVGGPDAFGSVLSVFEGELLLVIQHIEGVVASSGTTSRAPSRPVSTVDEAGGPENRLSRAPSIRVKTGPLERRTSANRRNSLPSISQRSTFMIPETSLEPPLRVTVRAGTVERLVDVLVFGLQGMNVSVADDNGESSLRESKNRDLVVNHTDFARVWWNVFRSFLKPLTFFEMMRKRYLDVQSAERPSEEDGRRNRLTRQTQIAKVMTEWLSQGGGARDVLDDAELYNSWRLFLDRDSVQSRPPAADLETQDAWEAYARSKELLVSSFTCQIMRPTSREPSVFKAGVTNAKVRWGPDIPNIDRMEPEQLVDNLEAMAVAAYSNVSEEDLFVTADLVEIQMADRAGWIPPRDSSASADDVEIQTMYSHLYEVEPTSMISELSQENLYKLLPPGIRSCMRAYTILRKWLVSKIVAFQIGIHVRQLRIDTILRAIEFARTRNADPSTTASSVVNRACARSFVETVLTSAIVSVESRAHQRAWQNVAAARNVQCDSLASLLRKPSQHLKMSLAPLTVDMSWILERILDIISVSNTLKSAKEDGSAVINFDKRRHICNLITTASMTSSRSEVDRLDFERLNNIEKETSKLQFDQRGIREEAHRESMQAPGTAASSGRKAVRPFQKLVVMQQEKNKRDKFLRDRIAKDKRLELHRMEKRDDQVAKGGRQPAITTQRQHRNKKSMSSAFFQFMRPISSAFTSESLDQMTSKKSPAELDFTPTGKPTLVLNIVDAKVSQFINNERSFTFQLDTEDGGHYLLQALSRRNMATWLDTISRVSKTAAKRRLTYLGIPKPQVADHIHNNTSTSMRDPTAVFGVELNFLLQREAANGEVLPGAIPFVIERCLYEIESRGLGEAGIYRIAGAVSEINTLKDAFNRGQNPIEPTTDIYAVCDLIKTWFRVLPEPLFPTLSYHEIIQSMKIEDFDARLKSIRTVVRALPQMNFNLLKRVSEHLDKVTDFEEQNHMTSDALAIVFSPNLLRAPQNDFAMILGNMGHTHKLVKSLITHFHVIFDDVDPEVENDLDEEDFDEPIIEEDEEDEHLNTIPEAESPIQD